MAKQTTIEIHDYAMTYEQIVLLAFNKTWRREDPGLGDADVFRLPDNELTGKYGHDLKFGLSVAIRKLQQDHTNEEVAETLSQLYKEVWDATSINDICKVIQKIKGVYVQLSLHIV